MKVLILIALTLLPTLSYAADDAPVMFEPLPDYVCTHKSQRLNEGKALKRCQDTNEALTKGNVVIPVPTFVAVTVGGIVLTAVVTGLVVGLAKK